MRARYGSARKRVQLHTGTVSRTKQSFKDECDIKTIMRKFENTGALPDMIKKQPHYGDFSSVPDYQSALNLVQHAQMQFDALSAKVRERFGNNPELFLKFATNPANAKEMVDLGLAIKRPIQGNVVENTTPKGKGAAAKKSEKQEVTE